MSNLVYFSSVSENTHRFVQKLGIPAIRIPVHGRIEDGLIDEPYVLVLPTYGGGRPPRTSTTVATYRSRSSPFSTTNTTGR